MTRGEVLLKLGDRLKEIREDQGLSQTELAGLVGTSQSTISQIEGYERNPSYQMLQKLADALDVKVSYLLGEVAVESLSPEEDAHFREYRGLSEAARRQLREYAQFLRMTQPKKKGEGDGKG
jgi:transcriptional regulator with XRE-family HTH domain